MFAPFLKFAIRPYAAFHYRPAILYTHYFSIIGSLVFQFQYSPFRVRSHDFRDSFRNPLEIPVIKRPLYDMYHIRHPLSPRNSINAILYTPHRFAAGCRTRFWLYACSPLFWILRQNFPKRKPAENRYGNLYLYASLKVPFSTNPPDALLRRQIAIYR